MHPVLVYECVYTSICECGQILMSYFSFLYISFVFLMHPNDAIMGRKEDENHSLQIGLSCQLTKLNYLMVEFSLVSRTNPPKGLRSGLQTLRNLRDKSACA